MNRTRLHYGAHHGQVGDLWLPAEKAASYPVVVLIHGGFWKQIYTKRLMNPMARSITAHGWAVLNVEYRRVGAWGGGGWPDTFDDISAAIDALAGLGAIDGHRVVTCGHSAGGHLALWAAGSRTTADPDQANAVKVHSAISLAGVVDLIEGARLGLGGGAVQALMGGSPDDHPDRYRLASPAALLPMGVTQLLIHGEDDTTVPASMSADYVDAATAKGDDARYEPIARTGHMEMIDPDSAAMVAIKGHLDEVR